MASSAPLEELWRDLDEGCGRLQALYGKFPEGSEQRRYIKGQTQAVSAQTGSVAASVMFHKEDGRAGAVGVLAG